MAITRIAFPELVQPPASSAVADLTAGRLTDWITDWSYLIEKNRVWNQAMTRR